MKHYFLLLIVCLAAMMVTSCQEEDSTFDDAIQIEKSLTLDEFKQFDAKLNIVPATEVEVITLEEYNKVLTTNGFDAVTKEQIEKRRLRLKSSTCDAILAYRDINGNGTVSVADVLLGQIALANCHTDSYPGVGLLEMFYCSSPSNQADRFRVYWAGQISHVNNCGNHCYIFTSSELWLMEQFLLGNIPC